MNIVTFFMFSGQAEEAMNFYVSLFPGSSIDSIQRYGAGEAGKEGTVKQAVFNLLGTQYKCIDSPVTHGFTFTPSTSLFVQVDHQEQLEDLANRLSQSGKFLMPVGSYGFSTCFAWIQDRFGISWQLNLP